VTAKEWFGGGMDVTPCIADLKQKKYFHRELKKTCDLHNKNYYKKHKLNCDKYFFFPTEMSLEVMVEFFTTT
jgi:coproporphyrinogen III oxidase